MELEQEGLQAIIGALAVGLAKNYLGGAEQAAVTDKTQLLNVGYLLRKIDEELRRQETYDIFVQCAQRAGFASPPHAENHIEVASGFASLTSKLIANGGHGKLAIESLRRLKKDYEQQIEICKDTKLSYENSALPETLASIFRNNYALEASRLYEHILAGLRSQESKGTPVKQFAILPKICLGAVECHSPGMAKSEELQFNEIMAFATPNISWQMPIIRKAVNLW